MSLESIARACGFTLQSTEQLPEIHGLAHVMLHDASQAKLLFLENDDANKAFSIAFRTPPADDTGVFHILEHSVLNGSSRFPVKEPFVNLLKTSMQTFLNAMTFPDKTMYPVASTNEQDLINLMDVYLDAVFHPAIYHNKAIFQQEGWHYELVDNTCSETDDVCESDDAAVEAHTLRWNGVVFNEMKGALSDAESVLYDTLQQLLFPDTPYRFESGGTPEAIPTLTYERFLEEHERHYRTDNSYIMLYGNLDIARMLTFLDTRYLTPVATEQREHARTRGSELTPRELRLQAPVRTDYAAKHMACAPENACAAIGCVIGCARDRVRVIAVDVLLDAIMGSNEAPLKRALLDANLAADANAYVADSLLQPFAVVELRGIHPEKAHEFRRVFDEAIHALANGGLDHVLLEAAISRDEFILREGNFGIPNGIAYATASMSGWLYDDDMPTAYLRFEDAIAYLREHLDDDWFENLIREVFIDNAHTALAEIVPTEDDTSANEARRLADIAATMTESDFERIEQDEQHLRAMQETPDTPQAVATLPRLAITDIAEPDREPTYELVRAGSVPCIRHSVETNGIVYAYRYFDLNCVSFEELPYVSLLGSLLGKMDTARHTAQELDTLINGRLGNLSFYQRVHEDAFDASVVRPLFIVSASALAPRVDYLGDLSREVMLETDFSNTDRILDVLRQRKAAMENAFVNAGHTCAMARLRSYYLPAGLVEEQLAGTDMYRFVKHLISNFDQAAPTLPTKLTELAARIFTDNNQTLSFAGPCDAWSTFAEKHVAFGHTNVLAVTDGHAAVRDVRLHIPEPHASNEAFIVASDVCYAAAGFDHRLINCDYSPSWSVAARALNYDYLWNEVRVKGGAYGAGFQAARAGAMRFYSYRDPHLDRTCERFDSAAQWLESYMPDADELEGYVVSTVAAIDNPLQPRAIVKRQAADVFAGRTWDDRLHDRKRVVGTTLNDARSLTTPLQDGMKHGAMCVFGNRSIIESSKRSWNVIDLMND
ncbi:insulinase family protein [Adlercreutzia sp. ZJ138]|uniref:insulinase family protein n=1 Tax=Adlercreutzia sp. ZJ138 TaxID=2709405 RepID=UPI0013ECFE90|nr:insulinase family protein [Adlercreutzia sp. ZJ138]